MIRHHKKGIESKMNYENAIIKDFPCKISQVYLVTYIPSICAIEGMSAAYYKFQISANVFK